MRTNKRTLSFIFDAMSSKSNDNNQSSRLEYNKVRNTVKRLMRQAKKSFERNISVNAKKNPKAVWGYIRQKMKTKTGVAPLLADNKDKESTKFDNKEKSDILQKQFASVFTRDPEGDIPTMKARTEKKIKPLKVTVEAVKKLIKKLNINKSVGPDWIHHVF